MISDGRTYILISVAILYILWKGHIQNHIQYSYTVDNTMSILIWATLIGFSGKRINNIKKERITDDVSLEGKYI